MVRTQIRDKVDSNIVSINSHEVLRHIPETEHLSNITWKLHMAATFHSLATLDFEYNASKMAVFLESTNVFDHLLIFSDFRECIN